MYKVFPDSLKIGEFILPRFSSIIISLQQLVRVPYNFHLLTTSFYFGGTYTHIYLICFSRSYFTLKLFTLLIISAFGIHVCPVELDAWRDDFVRDVCDSGSPVLNHVQLLWTPRGAVPLRYSRQKWVMHIIHKFFFPRKFIMIPSRTSCSIVILS